MKKNPYVGTHKMLGGILDVGSICSLYFDAEAGVIPF
jgi:hypothetical protein